MSSAHAPTPSRAGDLEATRRFAGLEGWWIVAGIIALFVLALLKLTLFA